MSLPDSENEPENGGRHYEVRISGEVFLDRTLAMISDLVRVRPLGNLLSLLFRMSALYREPYPVDILMLFDYGVVPPDQILDLDLAEGLVK